MRLDAAQPHDDERIIYLVTDDEICRIADANEDRVMLLARERGPRPPDLKIRPNGPHFRRTMDGIYISQILLAELPEEAEQ
jgi:hypothetical protein